MNYTKPLILGTEKAVFAIQQVNQTGSTGKIAQTSLDQSLVSCTPGAYEADE